MYLGDANGIFPAGIYIDQNGAGALFLKDTNHTNSIFLSGDLGVIWCKKIRASEGVEELYNGSLSSGNTTFNYGNYNLYIIVGTVRSGGSNITMTIPKAMLTGNDQSFCISDEADYITFKMKYSGTTATLTFGSRSSSGEICLVYGVN